MPTKKSILFVKERKEVCDKMLKILQLNDDNAFILCKLEDDEDKQKQIMDLADDIRKFYVGSDVASLRVGSTLKRKYLNIIRYLLKQNGYNLKSINYRYPVEKGLYKNTRKYKVTG